MNKFKLTEPVVKVTIENNTQVLKMPNGDIIPKVIWTRVHEDCEGPAYVIVKMFVNIGE